jgi:hypothetical protein
LLDIDLAAQATVLILPALPGLKRVATVKRGLNLAQAIRFVVESLPVPDRPRTMIRTRERSLYIAEIEAMYDRLEFARSDDRVRFSLPKS